MLEKEEYVFINGIQTMEEDEPVVGRNPLLVSSRGGFGHIAAIQALIERCSEQILHSYSVPKKVEKESALLDASLFTASELGKVSFFRFCMDVFGIPILPDYHKLKKNIEQTNAPEARLYVDVSDLIPNGDLFMGIWNTLQREDQQKELSKLIELQDLNDRLSYQSIYDYFLNVLLSAEQCEHPFAEMVSTQPIGIAALCDAIKEYNRISGRKIMLKQYMTDLPKGAVHFFNGLAKLNSEQQKLIKLYAVGINQEIVEAYFPKGHDLEIYNIPCDRNPMVRAAFYDPKNDNSTKFEDSVHLTFQAHEPMDIDSGEKIAAVMLGSQAGAASLEYAKALLHQGMDKVFVFGGANADDLQTQVNALPPELLSRIIVLKNQDATSITQLMTRCIALVIRSGGLSIMEQLAMKHHPKQHIFIHHPDLERGDRLRSGIVWEDANADTSIEVLAAKGINVIKTCLGLIGIQLRDCFPDWGISNQKIIIEEDEQSEELKMK